MEPAPEFGPSTRATRSRNEGALPADFPAPESSMAARRMAADGKAGWKRVVRALAVVVALANAGTLIHADLHARAIYAAEIRPPAEQDPWSWLWYSLPAWCLLLVVARARVPGVVFLAACGMVMWGVGDLSSALVDERAMQHRFWLSEVVIGVCLMLWIGLILLAPLAFAVHLVRIWFSRD